MKPKKNDLKPVRPKKSRWKTILAVLLLLCALSACAGPTAEHSQPRGTLPSAPVSEQVETQPPASEQASTSRPVPTSRPIPTLKPVPTPVPTSEPTPTPEPEPDPTSAPTPAGITYILNTNTYKFHYPRCSSAGQISPSNRREYTGTREQVISMGYSPCGRCHP